MTNKKPTEWKNELITMKRPPASPLKGKGFKRLAFNELEFDVSRGLFKWFFERLDETHKIKAWRNMAKISCISLEAADLLNKFKTFFEEKLLKEKALSQQNEKEKLLQISKNSGITFLKLKKKLTQFNLLAKGFSKSFSDIELLPRMIESSNEGWFFEAMLEGSIINNGYFLPGKILNKVKDGAEVIGLIALVNAPKTTNLPQVLDIEKLKYWDIGESYWLYKLLVTFVFPKAPWIRSKGKFEINSPDIIDLDCLCKHDGDLVFNRMESLNDIEAQTLSQDRWYRFLSITTLSDKAAMALSKHQNGNLFLDQITTLSDKAAMALSNHQGILSVKNLTNLDDSEGHTALAEKLAKQNSDLFPHHITTLTAKPAEALARHSGKLFLNSLTKLDKATAKSLAIHTGTLYLDGLSILTDETLIELAKHQGERLSLDHLVYLNDKAAKALAKYKGFLSIKGITSFFDSEGHTALAEKLANQNGDLFLDQITTLGDKAAMAISNHQGILSVKNLTNLDDSEGYVALAEKLANQNGDLFLDQITTLGDKAAKALSNHQGILSVKNLTNLDDSEGNTALAEKLTNQNGDLFLDQITTLSDKAAMALSNHQGILSVRNLTKLDDSEGNTALAEKLVNQNCDFFPHHITTLAAKPAEALARYSGKLFLNNLTKLDKSTAKSLAKHTGTLYLNGLSVLSDETLEELAKHQGERLSLAGMTNLNLSVKGAKALAKYKGFLSISFYDSERHNALAEKLVSQNGILFIDQITNLSSKPAETLARQSGKLFLNNLTQLDKATAKSLAKHKGTLHLDGLSILRDDTLEELAKHQGNYLSLAGLTCLSDKAAKALAKYKGFLSIRGITSFYDWEGHVALANKIANQKGDLFLDALVILEKQPAKSLAKNHGFLSLNRLSVMSDEVSEELAKHQGDYLSLAGLTSLSDKATKALAKYSRNIYLEGKTKEIFIKSKLLVKSNL